MLESGGPAWMTRPYLEGICERALARADAGETVRSIAEALQISLSCVTKWKNLRRETGGLSPGKIGGHKKPVLSGTNADWLRTRIRSGPFTLRNLTAELAERGIKTDVPAVWTFVHGEGLSFRKTMLPAEQDRPDIARKRVHWKAHQHRIDVSRLIFIDETWIKTKHGTAARLGAKRAASRRICAFRSLENHDIHRRALPRSD